MFRTRRAIKKGKSIRGLKSEVISTNLLEKELDRIEDKLFRDWAANIIWWHYSIDENPRWLDFMEENICCDTKAKERLSLDDVSVYVNRILHNLNIKNNRINYER